MGNDLVGLLFEQVEDHRQVVDAQRPECVLVDADDAEVLSVAVDAQHVPERAGVDQFLQLLDTRVMEQEVSGHAHEVALLREADELLHLRAAHGGRLLDEHVLACLERLLGEFVVSRHGCRDDDGIDLRVVQSGGQIGRDSRRRVAGGVLDAPFFVGIADPDELGELSEVPRQIPSPRADSGDRDSRHSFQTLGSARPASPVALRKSTTTFASRTTCAWSTDECPVRMATQS